MHAAALEDILYCPLLLGMLEFVAAAIKMLVGDLLFARFAVSLVMDGDNCFQLAASERHKPRAQGCLATNTTAHLSILPTFFLDKVWNQNKVIFFCFCILLSIVVIFVRPFITCLFSSPLQKIGCPGLLRCWQLNCCCAAAAALT